MNLFFHFSLNPTYKFLPYFFECGQNAESNLVAVLKKMK